MDQYKIAANKYYTISVSVEKNRAYLKIIGFWGSPDMVPHYIEDWKKALLKLKKGFTLLTDASEMRTHSQTLKPLHEEAQLLLKQKDVSKVAEIVKDDVSEMQLNSIAKNTQFPKMNFRDAESAEKWLDQLA